MTQPSSADQLRTAADKLRQAANAAEADVDTNPYWQSALTERPDWYANGVRNGLGGPSGDLAALMGPSVGTALADWLTVEMVHLENDNFPALHAHALAVARQILGEDTP